MTATLTEYLFQPAEAETWRRGLRHAARKTPLQYGNRPGTNVRRKPQKKAGDEKAPAPDKPKEGK